MKNSAETSRQAGDNVWKDMKGMLVYLFVLIVFLFLIFTFVGQQIEVNGTSMESTLQDKDHLILEKISYYFSEPERFDIIVFRPDSNQKSLYYIKRIIGLPGETIKIKEGQIFIDGEVLKEEYGNERMVLSGVAENSILLGEEEYFVLGDNRNHSRDSRREEVGLVKRRDIIGRAFLRIRPFNKFGVIRHQ